jgi:hypothetical protein
MRREQGYRGACWFETLRSTSSLWILDPDIEEALPLESVASHGVCLHEKAPARESLHLVDRTAHPVIR